MTHVKSSLYVFLVLLAAVLGAAGSASAQSCSGCGHEEYTWGGGANNEFWDYIPPIGGGDSEGDCYANCTYDPCLWKGSLKFRNATSPSGGADRDVTWPDGVTVRVNLGANLTRAVDVSAGCGQSAGTCPNGYAVPAGGGATTSRFIFSCKPCLPSAE